MEVFLEVRTRCGTTAVEEPEIQQFNTLIFTCPCKVLRQILLF